MSEMQNKLYDTANEMPLIDIRDGMFGYEEGSGGYDVRSVHEFLTRINKLVASDKNEAALELMDDYMDNIITVKDSGAYKNGRLRWAEKMLSCLRLRKAHRSLSA